MSTDPVCDFYTRYPYPPPVENLDRARDDYRDENRRRAEFHLLWPKKKYQPDIDILVAGCGTWQAAKLALCHPAARVIAIDVSATSLEHTARLKEKYNLSNLKTKQAAIENLSGVDQSFDLIVCTGVLHHLADPDKGLSSLRSVLKSDGVMYLMVYATYGRAGVYLLQDYCRRLGVAASTKEINDLATVVETLPAQHPLVVLLSGARESLTAEALADALLNPRERSYSVPDLFDLIQRKELKFCRWYWQAPYLPQCGSIASTPHAKRLTQLPEHEQFAALELWRGTMTTHSFIASRNEQLRVQFDDEQCSHYVPLRLPTTICVQERLPPDTAGVLLNRSHQHRDLILPIDAKQKTMFDAIDGRRTIAEITNHADKTGSKNARRFFEKLWWYDQVTFDMSNVDVA